jgi:hypothetical protein
MIRWCTRGESKPTGGATRTPTPSWWAMTSISGTSAKFLPHQAAQVSGDMNVPSGVPWKPLVGLSREGSLHSCHSGGQDRSKYLVPSLRHKTQEPQNGARERPETQLDHIYAHAPSTPACLRRHDVEGSSNTARYRGRALRSPPRPRAR